MSQALARLTAAIRHLDELERHEKDPLKRLEMHNATHELVSIRNDLIQFERQQDQAIITAAQDLQDWAKTHQGKLALFAARKLYTEVAASGNTATLSEAETVLSEEEFEAYHALIQILKRVNNQRR